MENVTAQTIENKIFTIRGVQVMLDKDLAELYEVETKRINEQVKRNIERFPEEFCFQLTKEEVESLRLQIVTLNTEIPNLKSQIATSNNKNISSRSQIATLNNSEIIELSSRSHFVTLNRSNNLRGYNIKYLPYVLTEQGIMMLSGLLKSDIAVSVNIQIINSIIINKNNLLSVKK